MPTNTGAGLQDVYTWMHITDLDDLVDIHTIMAADFRQLVGKCDVDGAEGVLNDLGHFGCFDIGNNNLTLAERCVKLRHFFTDDLIISTDGTIVVQQLIDHVARDNALRGMNKIDVRPPFSLKHRPYALFDGARTDSGFDN